jgi:hypothetical protein
VGVITEADKCAYAKARLEFKKEEFAELKPAEKAGIERCRQMFAAMGPPPEVVLEPGQIAGWMNARVITRPERHAYFVRRMAATAAAWAEVAADFIGPRRRGCLQRDDAGGLFIDMAGARAPWPAGAGLPSSARSRQPGPAGGV